MGNKCDIILCLVLILLILYTINYFFISSEVERDDINYFNNFSNRKQINLILNNNKLVRPKIKKNKFLFITFDNRLESEYIKIHNKNLEEYTKYHNYEYKFLTKCTHNVYWCKIHMVLSELKTNKYDYVVWLDSDTIIRNIHQDINDIINCYDSDIFVGDDNNSNYGIINAGVFIIKCSNIGKQFLQDCIDSLPEYCKKQNNKLRGEWAGSCYEQGIMNILIFKSYIEYTTMLPKSIIYNNYICCKKAFIMHLYASSNEERVKCFT